VTGIKDGGQANTSLEGLDTHGVNVVVYDVAILCVVDRIDDFIIAVILIAVQVFGLASVS
jgi:hypothetical protein